MTEASSQEALNALYEGDNSTPSATSTDYLTRRIYLNEAISIWEKEERWNELYAKSAGATGATLTTTATTSDYALPTNFKFMVGAAWIGTTSYELKPPEFNNLISSSNTSTYYSWITGNKSSGYYINFHPTPSTTGDTISYQYYKEATALSATTSIFEMSDPWFCIYYALSRLYQNDGKIADSRQAYMEASVRLDRMKEINLEPGFYQANWIPDYDFISGVAGFGK